MNRGVSLAALGVLLTAGIAGGVGLASKFERQAAAHPTSAEAALTLQSTFNRASAIATKAVVHITINEGRGADDVGSGVIVSHDGHIVTNYHVVRDAHSCLVRFVDGSEFEATIRGGDPDSDLAVLKIDRQGKELHPIVFADSDKAHVGDFVFAVGSPFGYTHTVTSGIVSAKHRLLEDNRPYQDYVQTDAAINPGNSGGALVNLRGELVGVNTAMVSGSKTNDGVGLAIASNLVKWVKDRLIRDGAVRRGFLGITRINVDIKEFRSSFLDIHRQVRVIDHPLFENVSSNEDIRKVLGLNETAGALVIGVLENQPAHHAGLLALDVLTEIDGRPVRSAHDLTLRVVELEPGQSVKLKVIRDKKPLYVTAKLIDRDVFLESIPRPQSP